jgi:anti-anti-sigma regulatory factor
LQLIIVITAGEGNASCIILDFSHVANIDFTTVEGFSHLLSEYSKAGSTMVVSNPQPHVLEAFESAKLKNFHYSPSVDEAIRLIKEIEETKLAVSATSTTLAELTDGLGLLERSEIGTASHRNSIDASSFAAAAIDDHNNNGVRPQDHSLV